MTAPGGRHQVEHKTGGTQVEHQERCWGILGRSDDGRDQTTILYMIDLLGSNSECDGGLGQKTPVGLVDQ